MGIENFIIFVLCFSIVIHVCYGCPASSPCKGNSIAIRYPFWLHDHQPQNCRPTGFKLTCTGNKTALYIRNFGELYVRSIDYGSRDTISLYDPDNCLLGRLLTLNLSLSPFKATYNQTYTLLSCPKRSVDYRWNVVGCLGNSTTDIVAIKNQSDVTRLSMCNVIVTLTIPKLESFYSFYYGLTDPETMDLTWDLRTCNDCGSARTGEERTRDAAKIALYVMVPILVVLLGTSCCIWKRQANIHRMSQAALPSTMTTGLDEFTIETYRKVTLSESRDVTWPNDATCAICIADYEPKDTIRFMPECEHCFHVGCIDKWLSMNSQCPICRTLQPRVDSSW